MQHDLIRLQHMLDAGKDALQFALGRDRNDLESDRMLALALIKALDIIGEAASKVSENYLTIWLPQPLPDRHDLDLCTLEGQFPLLIVGEDETFLDGEGVHGLHAR